MPKEMPSFLREFMEMRKAINKQAPPALITTAVATKGNPKKMKVSTSTSDGIKEEFQAISVQSIIEEKPPKKEVLEYFKKECDRLTAEKMK